MFATAVTSVAAEPQRAELEELAGDVERFHTQRFGLLVRQAETIRGGVDDLAEAHAAVEGGDHLLRIRRGLDRMLRPLGELARAVDVAGAPAGRLELAVESQARGDSDAGIEQGVVVSDLREGRACLERTQDLIAGVIELL